jgi:ribosome modulation factor
MSAAHVFFINYAGIAGRSRKNHGLQTLSAAHGFFITYAGIAGRSRKKPWVADNVCNPWFFSQKNLQNGLSRHKYQWTIMR